MTDPAAPQAPAVPVVPVPVAGPPAAPQPRPRRALGATGFVLSLIAFLGDIVIGIVLIATFITAIGNLVTFLEGRDGGSFGAAAAVFIAAILAGIGGTVLAVVGLILGCVAAARNRGRVLGIFAIVLGALVLLTRILGIIAIASNGSGHS